VFLKPDNNSGTLHEDPYKFFFIISRSNCSYNEKYFRQKLWIKSKSTFCVQQHFFENRAVYEIMWKNTVQPDRPKMTIWRMRIACWITKATDTILDTYCFSTTRVVTRTRLNLTLCVKHTACLVLPQFLMNDTIFERKKKLLNTKCVFRVSL